jgi:hypothetical protein
VLDEIHCPLSSLDLGGKRWRSDGLERVPVHLLSFAGVAAERLSCGPETIYARLGIGFPAAQFVDQFAQFGQRNIDAASDVQDSPAIGSLASQLATHDENTPQQKENGQGERAEDDQRQEHTARHGLILSPDGLDGLDLWGGPAA